MRKLKKLKTHCQNKTDMDSIDRAMQAVPQNSDMWDSIRLGRFTASEMHRLIPNGKRPLSEKEKESIKLANPKSKSTTIEDPEILGKGGETYAHEKVAEMITGESSFFENFATKWGHEHEDRARELFANKMKIQIEQIGFYPYKHNAGGSPDAIFFDAEGNRDGILEIKCPFNSTNHIEHLLIRHQDYFKENFPEYYWQMQSNMLFTDTKKGWFISYDPRAKKEFQMFAILIERHILDCQFIEKKIQVADKYKNDILKLINSKLEK